MRIIFIAILFFTWSHQSFAGTSLRKYNRKTEKQIRKSLRNGSIDKNKTCLDEYYKRYRSLKWKTRLIPFAGVGAAAASVPTGYMFAFGGSLFFGPTGAIVVGIFGGLSAFSSWVGTAWIEESKAVKRFRSNREILFSLWQAQSTVVESPNLAAMAERYNNFAGTDLSTNQFRDLFLKKDKTGVYCNGVLSGKPNSRKLRKLLADEQQIFQAL